MTQRALRFYEARVISRAIFIQDKGQFVYATFVTLQWRIQDFSLGAGALTPSGWAQMSYACAFRRKRMRSSGSATDFYCI